MLTTIKAVYRDGSIVLLEPMPPVSRARLTITVFPEAEAAGTPKRGLRQMAPEERTLFLAELRARWRDRLSPSEDFARAKDGEIALEDRRQGGQEP